MTDPGELPPVGLGTMGLDAPDSAASVTRALELGYRHVDTAQIYGNEALVGDAIAASSVPREEVFLATKVWADKLAYEDVLSSAEGSLDRLGTEYVDLLYVHRPIEAYDPPETLAAFDRLREAGTVRHVGASNFSVAELDEALDLLDAPLFAHQTEYHPLFRRPELVDHAGRHDYHLVAYSPLAGGRVFDLPELTAVAEKHGTDEATVSVAWLLGKENVVVIPKASSGAHLRANLAARDLELDAEDVAAIESIAREEELFPE
ncbi:aldo/keto reductase [Halegenticoccus tardaugens]|uniref:aldo/keto reductase n=1 Tax=Halegenticoccus tardaugens TaxID=2071624 RepID=UPI00100B2C03|nr:aldo/keto reductase [Halegenticoccus tardaugens]